MNKLDKIASLVQIRNYAAATSQNKNIYPDTYKEITAKVTQMDKILANLILSLDVEYELEKGGTHFVGAHFIPNGSASASTTTVSTGFIKYGETDVNTQLDLFSGLTDDSDVEVKRQVDEELDEILMRPKIKSSKKVAKKSK